MQQRILVCVAVSLLLHQLLVSACLITNCPRGGKRSSKVNFGEKGIKPCISCGPNRSGQCFGPNICCGPFGCLLGTADTTICKREGLFHEDEPCVAGSMPCRKGAGRCATEGICCSQESCQSDKMCSASSVNIDLSPAVQLLEALGGYQNRVEYLPY